MKVLKRVCSFLTVICCLAGSILPVSASQAGTVPRATFTNEQKQSPDLYVKKVVSNASEAPGSDEFTFTLYLEERGKLERAAKEAFTLYNGDGSLAEECKDSQGNIKKIYTGVDGTFVLKAGQTAHFESEGSERIRRGVQYAVSEAVPNEYVKESADQTEGWIPAAGVTATITNKYTPKVIEKEKTTVKVAKTVISPSGYQAPESPVFRFKIEVKTAAQKELTAWAGGDYVVKEGEGADAASIRSAQTGADGTFLLEAGCVAWFELPPDCDYKVTELTEEDALVSADDSQAAPGWEAGAWWQVGRPNPEVQYGSQTLHFSNANTSLIVTKELIKPEDSEEQMPDEEEEEPEFQFLLTDAAGGVRAGVAYYLYEIGGARKDDVLHNTDENGNFWLKADEAAVFIGIAPGQSYKVSEVADPKYKQIEPADLGGYSGTVSKDSVTKLPFKNEMVPQNRSVLRITKNVEGTRGELPTEEKTFQFRISYVAKSNINDPLPSTTPTDAEFRPLAGQAYKLETGDGETSQKTDSDGRFTIKRGQTVQFEGIPIQTYYKVEEIALDELGNEYTVKGSAVQVKPLQKGKPQYFVFTNTYTPDFLNLVLTKVNGSGAALKGAEFMLYTDEACQRPATEEALVTDESGMLTIMDVKSGTYYLKETKAPSGYVCLDAIKLEIIRTGSNFTVTVDDKLICGTDEEHASSAEGGKDDVVANVSVSASTTKDKNDEISLTVRNTILYKLPHAGGFGIYWYSIGGMLLMLVSVLILYKNNFAGRC